MLQTGLGVSMPLTMAKGGGPVSRLRQVTGRTGFPNTIAPSLYWAFAQNHAPIYADIENDDLIIRFPACGADTVGGLYGTAKDIDYSADATATAMVMYYDLLTGAYTEVQLEDLTTGLGTLTPHAGFLEGAVANKNIRHGRLYYRVRANFPTTGVPYSSLKADYANGDVLYLGASAPPALNTVPINTSTGQRAWYGACNILAVSNKEALGEISDSRDAGFQHIPATTWGGAGQFEAVIDGRMPSVNMSVGGDSGRDFAVPAQSVFRRSCLQYADKLAIGFGINPLYFNQTRNAVETMADNLACRDLAGFSAANTILKTLDPAAFDNTNTVVSRPTREAERLAYNDLVKAMTVFYDPATRLQSLVTPGLFRQSSFLLGDGTHEAALANTTAAADMGAMMLAWLGNPSVMAMPLWTPSALGAQLVYQGPISGLVGKGASDNTIGLFLTLNIPDLSVDTAVVIASASGGFHLYVSSVERIGVNRYSAGVQVLSPASPTVPTGRPTVIGVDMVIDATLRAQFTIDSQVLNGDRASPTGFTAARTIAAGGLDANALGDVLLTTGALSNVKRQQIEGYLAWQPAAAAQSYIHASSPYQAAPPTV